MKQELSIILLAAFMLLMAFKRKTHLKFEIPKGWPQTKYDFKKRPLTSNKVQLGRMLFYDPILSRDSTISCASCHLQYTAFTHTDHSLSHGIEGKIGTRNSPVLINLAWSEAFMWDGSVTDLDTQPETPITHPLEMDMDMPGLLKRLNASTRYKPLFKNAFGTGAIHKEQVSQALSGFMLMLVSANAKYDKVQRGEDTFTTAEANGYTLFKKHCNACHTEPLFTNNRFENNGLSVDETLNDIGHMKVTGNRDDSLKFKVPTLRNIALSYPYMHDGRFKNLSMVLNNYMMGIQHSPTLSPHLQKGLYFTTLQKAELIAFLSSLTDKGFLYNPDFGFSKK